MDTTQEELVAALIRRLQGLPPLGTTAVAVEREVIELDASDDELITLD